MMPASSANQVQHSTNGGDTRELAGAFDWALETGERLGRQEESWRTLHARSVSKSGEPCTEGLYSSPYVAAASWALLSSVSPEGKCSCVLQGVREIMNRMASFLIIRRHEVACRFTGLEILAI
ncbi:uncharacterized protein LOC118403487 [Branchiostoma floridae]|uniref:Uncharacterized protein LOC118403487 n=1 Tax=Branchiostoma floridae TaxID=7739 RepID=A0A9J7KGW6_BRAFL|nr:uncharacterized protein LOC118403487 [Branchiostoma floridae]